MISRTPSKAKGRQLAPSTTTSTIPYPHTRWPLNDYKNNPGSSFALLSRNYARPYLAIPGGGAFVWPLPVDGFTVSTSADLGIHKYLGTNKMDVDVVHRGQRNISLSGLFVGDDAPRMMQALFDIIEKPTPATGKVLHLPGIFPYTQYVQVQEANCAHSEGDYFPDIHYDISFVRIGVGPKPDDAAPRPIEGAPPAQNKGDAPKTFVTTGEINSLRKVASHLYRDVNRWHNLYDLNKRYFNQKKIPLADAANERLPVGTPLFR